MEWSWPDCPAAPLMSTTMSTTEVPTPAPAVGPEIRARLDALVIERARRDEALETLREIARLEGAGWLFEAAAQVLAERTRDLVARRSA